VDYWIWSLQISGIGTTISALNFIVTIIKMRAPGMTIWKMPLFTWGSLCSMIMAITVFPLLTATLFLSFFDRYLGTHFFTIGAGGDPMLYTSLIWMWGHPEVYILVLPAFGVFGEVVSVFSRKPIASYATAVLGMIGVSALALSVWLHHFFTMGAGADVNAWFGLMTMVIAIPTAVLMYTWIATLYKGRIKFTVPMLWFLGFVWTFTVGGVSGVMLGIPPVDFQLHNSLFLVAHFHSNVIGGVLFGTFAGITYWFPKFAGFRLNERIGRNAFWFWVVGFSLSFIPMYILGLMGATRRLDTYDVATGWHPFYILMLIGGIAIVIGVALQLAQIIASVIEKKRLVDATGDPWNGRTLEWAVPSPVPSYNFTKIPTVSTRDAFWTLKSKGLPKPAYEDIQVVRNTSAGIWIALFAFLAGFGFVWEIGWLVVVSLVAVVVSIVLKAFDEDSEYTMKAEEVKALEEKRLAQTPKAPRASDDDEEMGTWDLIKYLYAWALDVLKNRRWRSW
jgi:cytochrome o ubiquinol oxidase subunit 1